MKKIVLSLAVLVASLLVISCEKEDKNQDDFLKRWADTNCGSTISGDYYAFGSMPCPNGYRVPNQEEFRQLISYPRRYATNDTPDGLPGIWFGLSTSNVNKATAKKTYGCLFFPKSGHKLNEGQVEETNYGFYWSNTATVLNNNAWCLYLNESDIVQLKANLISVDDAVNKCSIRCIKEVKE